MPGFCKKAACVSTTTTTTTTTTPETTTTPTIECNGLKNQDTICPWLMGQCATNVTVRTVPVYVWYLHPNIGLFRTGCDQQLPQRHDLQSIFG
jgi:hypothetical protein